MSAARLAGLPPLVWINLDAKTGRRARMEAAFGAWGVRHAKRFSAIPGERASAMIEGAAPADKSANYLGCMLSHLSVVTDWAAEGAGELLMVMEDDCKLDLARHWPFDWADFLARAPYNFDALQLSLINPRIMNFRLHRRHLYDWSLCAYVVTRPYAEKLARLHRVGDRFLLDNLPYGRASVEDMMLESGATYSMPIFTYRVEEESSLDRDHIDALHRPCDDLYRRFWAERSARVTDWDAMFTPFAAFDANAAEAGLYIGLPKEARFLGER